MTLEELEKFPNVLDALREHYIKKLEDSIKQTQDIPDDFRQMLKERGITDDMIISVINESSRNLFDFFDDHKIIIEMTFMHEIGLGQFVSLINGEMTGMTHVTRKDAEAFAVEIAIEMLEEELTKSVSDKENS